MIAMFPTILKFELTGVRRAAILHAARELKCKVIYRQNEAFDIVIETVEKAFEFGWFCARDKDTWPLVINTEERSKHKELTAVPNRGNIRGIKRRKRSVH